jgi:S-adenosylmethionine:tRNA ribosyltransferase-isomerase
VNVADFDFELPPDLIAQEPPLDRSGAKLLYLARDTGAIAHSAVSALPTLLRPGDLLVVNNTRVFPARLLGHRVPSGGAVECVLLTPVGVGEVSETTPTPGSGSDTRLTLGQLWEALVHPGQKLKPGARVAFDGPSTGSGLGSLHGEILERRAYGRRLVRLWTEDGSPVDAAVDAIGHVPLPPYIKRADSPADRDRYQTIFAQPRGSVAAPTAGLHFTGPLVRALRDRQIEIAEITLHVGYGTFQPIRVDVVEEHRLEPEHFDISEHAAAAINRAVDEGRRVVAVGTTTTRTLEAAALAKGDGGRIRAGAGATDLFIYPGFTFRVVGGLLTNFHLPKSSLLMLVSAFAGSAPVLAAYREAVAHGYRFYSYGDAMLII